jgi:hypothetical protein
LKPHPWPIVMIFRTLGKIDSIINYSSFGFDRNYRITDFYCAKGRNWVFRVLNEYYMPV